MNFIRVIFVVFVLAVISGCSSIDNQILGNWHCENCKEEKILLILEDNRIFQTPQNAQYEYDILEKGLMELDRVNPFFLLRWLREFFCILVTCEQVIEYQLAKDGTLHMFWDGKEEIYRKVSLDVNTSKASEKSVASVIDAIKFISNLSVVSTGTFVNSIFKRTATATNHEVSIDKNRNCHAVFSFQARKIWLEQTIKIDFSTLNPSSVEIHDTNYMEFKSSVHVRTTDAKKEISYFEKILPYPDYGTDSDQPVTFSERFQREEYKKAYESALLRFKPQHLVSDYIIFYPKKVGDEKKIKTALISVITQCGGKDDLF